LNNLARLGLRKLDAFRMHYPFLFGNFLFGGADFGG